MTLFIDTTNPKEIILEIGDKIFKKNCERPQDQAVLEFINKSLKELSLNKESLTEIKVNLGPGSFTGTRVGVAIANSLAYALNLPINGQKPPLLPIYSQSPNITVAKTHRL